MRTHDDRTSHDNRRAVPRSSDEAGTAPGDRRFRPDIQGLRAVAVLLVVLYHAGLNGLSGGYVGVDVFFVISGFVITGLLLRERGTGGWTSLVASMGGGADGSFPQPRLSSLSTVVMTYARVGLVLGTQTATDARWTAVFLANFHFASIGTNYLTAQLPPSPLQNFWSLAVEEQFYLVYPTMFLLVAGIRTRWSLRARLFVCLAVVIISFTLSVVQTGSSPTVAYFSPFTRGGSSPSGSRRGGDRMAAHHPEARQCRHHLAWARRHRLWRCRLRRHHRVPGSWSIPVLGAALVIAGGTNGPEVGHRVVLRLGPFQWLGKLSYSIYLWHWPFLIIAAEAAGMSSLRSTRTSSGCLSRSSHLLAPST